MDRVLVTGGAGFIGSAAVRRLVKEGAHVLNVDKLTYAGDPRTVAECERAPHYRFLQADIGDAPAMNAAFSEFRPTVVLHLAAESHVDRSIDGPSAFVNTNLGGTFVMLEAALAYWRTLGKSDQARFRYVHVSTDEVYGSLGEEGRFTEDTPYAPNSPYSATKAGSDHLARAWFKTYDLPVLTSNCSNNYGPFQNHEKFIPTILRSAIHGQPIPIYGAGKNMRDWLFVEDHVDALLTIAERGVPGEKYNVGGGVEFANIDLARKICTLLDERRPRKDGRSYSEQISMVQDRPGHDFRYAIDCSKLARELCWTPAHDFAAGIARTVDWYLANPDWLLPSAAAGRLGLTRATA